MNNQSIGWLETFCQKLENHFHPNHYLLLANKLSLSQLYGKVVGCLIHQLPPELLQRKIDICKSILKVFDVLEPGLSRIRGITMYELQAPLMVLTTQNFGRQMINMTGFKNGLREVVNYLKETDKILSFENEDSPEGLIGKAVKEALKDSKQWENQIGKF